MDDQALTQLILASNPQLVALVGEPVFRLAPLLSQDDAVGKSVRTIETLGIEDYAQALERENKDNEVSDSRLITLCINLPPDSENIDAHLGLACRYAPNLVVVEQSETETNAGLLPDQRFFAFGFRSLGQATNKSNVETRWYTYRLSDYKQAPDWLNARFWAHPERFDLSD